MSRSHSQFNVSSVCLLFSGMLAASTAQAAIDISQSPLETGTAVPPNILFVLDDSGSMRWGFMPDELDSNFNLGSNCSSSISYGGTDVKRCRATGRRYLASSYLNKVYYDPTVTYKLPSLPDNSDLYPLPSYYDAPYNGFSTTSGRINLSNNYRAIIADYNYPDDDNGFTINSSDSNVNAVGAFYYKFNNAAGCSNSPRSDSCYTLVSMNSATASQKTNFAIWYSYYRTRLLASKSGVSSAFQTQGEAIRVGYGSINTSGLISQDVANFSGGSRTGFFSWLHKKSANGGTPLVGALNKAGAYFASDKPWKTDPSKAESALLECRQNFTILMTDGYYSDSISGVGDQDSTDGAEITGPKGKNYTYLAKNPFKDGKSNTLGDVAMKYWKTDLRLDLANTVPFTGLNPAFWQHMVTFGVGLGVSGSLNATAAFNAISSNDTVDWWGGNSDQDKVNDLLHAGVNSRGGFFTADKPDVFSARLAATLSAILERVGSASNIAATAINSLQTESNLYQARYVSGPWAGDLWSYEVTDIGTPVWKASEQVPDAEIRNILVGNGSTQGRNFAWDLLTSAEKAALGGNANIVDYLRGSRDNEQLKGGGYRDRISPLGDLVNSSPELVGEPIDMSYHRFSWDGAAKYRDFLSGDAKSRTPMIYVGANDGMLHGFNSDTGVEKVAFIPQAVMQPVDGTHNILKKYAEPAYVHRFSVDGSPTVADVYLGEAWASILVGGLGRGGNSLYALNVTNPNQITGSEVLWDKSFTELGIYLGKPQIYRLENGKWGILVGYGYNNSTHQSGLLVIDIATGTTLAKIPTGQGTASEPNGMSEVNVLDTDSDGNIDWVYGGDMLGYVWKFDLTSENHDDWALANDGEPLFRALDKDDEPQMITGGVMSSVDPKTGKSWLFFGTGRYLNQDDPSNNQTQTWYGIIDGPAVSGRNELAERIMTKVGEDRVVTSVPSLEEGKKGWYMDLIDSRERIVDLPVVIGGDLVMNTTIPDTNVCNPSGSGYVMAIKPYTGGRLSKTFFDVNDDENFTEADQVTHESKKVEVSGIKVGSLNSVVTFTKKGVKVIALVNCENANVCEEPANVNRNTGLQSWHEISF